MPLPGHVHASWYDEEDASLPSCLRHEHTGISSCPAVEGAVWLRGVWQSPSRIIQPLASQHTINELKRVLACKKKFDLSAEEQNIVLDDYLPFCQIIPIPDPPPQTPQCRDTNDQKFIDLALSGDADALVTGDNDILSLKNKLHVRILSLNEFRHELS